ncbi:LysR family transcriptional regulator [Marinococcus sp. PL1-022]|uniref:LysR family transcriptional regulator n=1 Tax=Marinococcus sp. PL1-022 TaxID=3095363 RepID=UPI0029C241F0|nr:LysR family transcriptional regulator [Marinococcus sp. PL1-022]MDX6154540.1 LysR family transcriptional regulator [Marinococcus sp. PL1-022]
MDIENMRAFVTVAERASISQAAADLHHLQSNMTAKIKKMEAYYEQELFDRHPNGVQLTEAGETLYEQFQQILLLWQETEKKMGKGEEHLRVGTMISMGGDMIAPALEVLYQAYPNLTVTFKTGSTEELEAWVAKGELDIAYVIGALHQPTIYYEEAGKDEMVIIGKNIPSDADVYTYLDGKDMITLSSQCLYFSTLAQAYTKYHLKQGKIIEVSDFDTLVGFSTIGMGLAVVSKHVAHRYHITNYLEIPAPYNTINVYRIHRGKHVFSAIERQFLEQMPS